MTGLRRAVLVGALAFVLLVLGVYAYFKVHVFASPENCKVCHFIVPFYERWAASAHGEVPCLECHDYRPLNAVSGQLRFLVGTYNPRPFTRVPDDKCLQQGCHEQRLLEAREVFTRWRVQFDHRGHFQELRRGLRLHCRSCHSDIAQGEHVKVSKDPCFLCHFKGMPDGQAYTGCPSCHTAPRDDIMFRGRPFSHRKALRAGLKCQRCHLQVTEGSGVVPRHMCYFCHVQRAEMYDDVVFVHQRHVEQGQLDCLRCHPRIRHGHIKMAERLPL